MASTTTSSAGKRAEKEQNVNTSPPPLSSGVEELITRLRENGVQRGRTEASRIISEAETRAEWIIRQAKEEAETIRREARQEQERFITSGNEALEVAARNMILAIRERLTQGFTHRLREQVREETNQHEVLLGLIMLMASASRDAVEEAKLLEILLPNTPIESEFSEQTLMDQLLDGINHAMLRDGVSFSPLDSTESGIRCHLKGEDIVLDLTDSAIAEQLLHHMLPKYRALLEKVLF
ncbi:MAG: hypothetical protein HQL50_12570 [Magnetococcales bacterium]|nr:hypothetical protein [Magnetococcales bacterium]